LNNDSQLNNKDTAMAKVQIYDQALCCSTGVCGPQVDPALPRFAADLDWLAERGNSVERFNLAQRPEEFAKNATVQQMLTAEGVECLPLVIVNDNIMSRSEYPSRENLALWTQTTLQSDTLPIADSNDCCGGSDCC
jgi:hypothetical protein